MKKILLVVGILLVVLCSNVYADTFNDYVRKREDITGIYFYRHRDDTATTTYSTHNFYSIAAIDELSNGEQVYCIESWATLTGAGAGDYIESLTYTDRISDSTLDRIKKIIYYGYGYKDAKYDHTDKAWAAVTQYMIWQLSNPEIEHYFVYALHNKLVIHDYDSYVEELNQLVDEYAYNFTTSVIGDKYMVGEEAIFTTNQSLEDVEFVTSDNIDVEVIDNYSYKVKMLKSGSVKLELIKKRNRFNRNTSYYISDDYQDAISLGDLPSLTTEQDFNIVDGTVTVNIYEEIGENIKELDNISVGLYNKDTNELISTSNTIDGTLTFNKLGIGNYYVKELNNLDDYIDGYLSEEFTILSEVENTINFYHHLPNLNINITKLGEVFNNNTFDYENLSDIEFSLYDEDDNLILTDKTDKDGYLNINLNIKYGKYYLKENVDNKYELVEPILINFTNVNDEGYLNIDLNIKNDLKKTTLEINKIDADTYEPIENVVFNILDEDKNIIDTLVTNELGVATIILPYGKYYIEEMETDNKYELLDSIIEIDGYDEYILETIKNTKKYVPIEVSIGSTGLNSNIMIFIISSIISMVSYLYVKKIN